MPIELSILLQNDLESKPHLLNKYEFIYTARIIISYILEIMVFRVGVNNLWKCLDLVP